MNLRVSPLAFVNLAGLGSVPVGTGVKHALGPVLGPEVGRGAQAAVYRFPEGDYAVPAPNFVIKAWHPPKYQPLAAATLVVNPTDPGHSSPAPAKVPSSGKETFIEAPPHPTEGGLIENEIINFMENILQQLAVGENVNFNNISFPPELDAVGKVLKNLPPQTITLIGSLLTQLVAGKDVKFTDDLEALLTPLSDYPLHVDATLQQLAAYQAANEAAASWANQSYLSVPTWKAPSNIVILSLLFTHLRSLRGCYFATRVNSAGLVKPISFFVGQMDGGGYQLCVAMPKVEGVTLSKVDPKSDSLEDIVDMMLQSARIFLAIQEAGYAHADVKSDNIMWDKKVVRVIDLDGMVTLGERPWTVTPGFLPPEAEVPGGVSSTYDVFSLGMTFAGLLGAGNLKVENDKGVDYTQIGQILGQITGQYNNPTLSALLSGMLMVDPNERWSFTQVIEQLEKIQRSFEARATNQAA